MANPLKDTFDFVRECYTQWFRALRHPWSVAAHLLAGDAAPDRIGRAIGFWFSAFFLSIIVSLPIYTMYGLKLENLSFQLCAVLAEYLILLLASAAFHYALRLYRIESVFSETFTLYTVVTAALGPIITFLALPALLRSLRITSHIKASNMSFVHTAQETLRAMFSVDSNLSTLLVLALDPVMTILGLFILSTFIQLLAEHYGAQEATVVRAISFASGVICPVLLVAVITLHQALLFAFVS